MKIGEIGAVLRGKTPSEYVSDGVPVLRATDLSDVSEIEGVLQADPTSKLFYLAEGDVLISSIGAGSIGKVAVFKSGATATAAVSEISIIRTNGEMCSEAIAAFLRSSYGQLQIERRVSGSTGQLHLLPAEIEEIEVPLMSETVERQLVEYENTAIDRLVESRQRYDAARALILDALGWPALEDMQFEHSWTIDIGQTASDERIDAEHFHPRYRALAAHLGHLDCVSLASICSRVRRGAQPEYVPNGPALVVNSRHVGHRLLDPEETQRTSEAFWSESPDAQTIRNDVLLNSTGVGSVGRANVVMHDAPTLVDNHVTVLRAVPGKCNPAYLAVYLNSPFGRWQTAEWTSGSSGQIELYPDAIKQFRVALASPVIQDEVEDLVEAAFDAKVESRTARDNAAGLVASVVMSSAS